MFLFFKTPLQVSSFDETVFRNMFKNEVQYYAAFVIHMLVGLIVGSNL